MPTEKDVEPLLVRMADERFEQEAADWGSFQAFTFSTTSNLAQQILPQNSKRLNAYIIVFGATGFVRVGTRGQVMNIAGAQLTGPIQIKYEATQEVWAVGDGINPFTINVLDHRYE